MDIHFHGSRVATATHAGLMTYVAATIGWGQAPVGTLFARADIRACHKHRKKAPINSGHDQPGWTTCRPPLRRPAAPTQIWTSNLTYGVPRDQRAPPRSCDSICALRTVPGFADPSAAIPAFRCSSSPGQEFPHGVSACREATSCHWALKSLAAVQLLIQALAWSHISLALGRF